MFLNFRIPITRNLIILFFLPLLSSTLPKSELCAAITTISTYDHSKVSPSKNEEKSPTAALSVTYTSSFSCMLVVSRANHPFQHVFPLFPTATRKCVCVCVSVAILAQGACPLAKLLAQVAHPVTSPASDPLRAGRTRPQLWVVVDSPASPGEASRRARPSGGQDPSQGWSDTPIDGLDRRQLGARNNRR